MRIALRNFKGGVELPPGLQVYIHGLQDNHWIKVGVEYPNLVVEDSTRTDIALPNPLTTTDVLKDLQEEMRKQVGGQKGVPTYLHPLPCGAGDTLRKYIPFQVLAYPVKARVNTLYTLWVGSLHWLFTDVLKGALSVTLSEIPEGDVDLTSITTNASKKRREVGNLALTSGRVVRGSARYTLQYAGEITTESFVERVGDLMKSLLYSPVSPLLESTNSHLLEDTSLDETAKEKLSPDLSPLKRDFYTEVTADSTWYWGTASGWLYRLLGRVAKLPWGLDRWGTIGCLALLRRYGVLTLRKDKPHPMTLTRVVNVNVWSRVYSVDRGRFIPLPVEVEGLPTLTALYARIQGWADSTPDQALRAIIPVLIGYGAELPALTPVASAEVAAFLAGELEELSPSLRASMLEWVRAHLLGEFVDAAELQKEEV